jgi:DNA-binding response OmpR family regulator
MRVLMIDDEKDLVSTLSERLDIRGISSDWATNGAQGVRMSQDQPYDWVLVDIKMPGMNGFEAVRAIKQSQGQAKIIMLTGHSSPEDCHRAQELGVEHYLVKPVEIDDLLSILRAEQA